MSFDHNKPLRRRDSVAAEKVYVDPETGRILAVHQKEGYKASGWHWPDGRINQYSDSPADLVNIPETVTTWQNVYMDGHKPSRIHVSRDIADDIARGRTDRLGYLIRERTGDVVTARFEPLE